MPCYNNNQHKANNQNIIYKTINNSKIDVSTNLKKLSDSKIHILKDEDQSKEYQNNYDNSKYGNLEDKEIQKVLNDDKIVEDSTQDINE